MQPVIDRFSSRTRGLPSGCIEWTGRLVAGSGSGLFDYVDDRGVRRSVTARSFAYERRYGARPQGRIVLTCATPSCVNPDHMAAPSSSGQRCWHCGVDTRKGDVPAADAPGTVRAANWRECTTCATRRRAAGQSFDEYLSRGASPGPGGSAPGSLDGVDVVLPPTREITPAEQAAAARAVGYAPDLMWMLGLHDTKEAA